MNDKNPRHGESRSNGLQHRQDETKTVISLYDLFKVIFTILTLIPIMIFSFIKYYFNKKKSLQGKICLVTGAGRGLGRELCLELFRLGAEVICVDIIEDINTETVKLIKESGGKAHGYICNVAKYQDVANLAETIQKEVGRVYMLVNNAGLIMTHNAGNWPHEDVTAIYNVNILSHYWMIQSFLPAMKEVNEGHVVGIASISSKAALPGLSVYGATKAALDSMLRTLGIELNRCQNNKIKVTIVHPSVIDTSNDIKALYSSSNMKMLRVDEVAKIIIEEVRLDNTSFSIPKYTNYMLYLLNMFPASAIEKVYEILNINVNIPSGKDKDNFMFSKINKKCVS